MRFRPKFWATALVIPALATLIALGTWQVQRREWKHDLLARIAAERAAPPRDLVEVLSGPDDQRAYAHVEADGTLDATRAVHVFAPAGQGGADYRVIAPLDYGDGRIVLVDLGTITEAEKKALPGPVPAEAGGLIHVEGILRPSESQGWADAAPDVKANRWYVRDVPAIAAALGFKDVPPYVLQSESPNKGGVPRPVAFQPELPDNHLAYAVTWFSLALILSVIYVLLHLQRTPHRTEA